MPKKQTGMSVFDHVGELRKRIVYVLVIFVLGLVVGLIYSQPIYDYLVQADSAQGYELNAFSFWDGVGVYMKIAMILSLVVTIPFTVFQLWKFVSPGLRPIERSAALRYIPFVFILFILGILFGYYVVFPMALAFTAGINERLGLTETYGITQYFSFLFGLIVPLALLFELPVVVMFLTKIRILNPLRLRKMRRVAYFALVFIAVVITPPDFISDFLVIIPLLLLYEFSVFLSTVVYRKQLKADQEVEDRYGKRTDSGESVD